VNYDDPQLRNVAERLDSPDSEIRRVAVLDLVDLDDAATAGLLMKALKDSCPSVRFEAAKIVDEFEADDIADALLDALSADDHRVRSAAANALADLKDTAAAPALLAALTGDDAFVLAGVLRALKPLRVPQAEYPALNYLEHPAAAVRREAVGVLGYLHAESALPRLMSTARNDEDSEVRLSAVGSLVYGQPETVAASLVDALADPHWQVRAEAAVALGKLGIDEAVPPLVAATSDDFWQVREKAAEALGKLRAVAAVDALGECTRDEVANLRKTAIGALGEIAHPNARPFVEAALRDPDPDVRKLARWARDRLDAAA